MGLGYLNKIEKEYAFELSEMRKKHLALIDERLNELRIEDADEREVIETILAIVKKGWDKNGGV